MAVLRRTEKRLKLSLVPSIYLSRLFLDAISIRAQNICRVPLHSIAAPLRTTRAVSTVKFVVDSSAAKRISVEAIRKRQRLIQNKRAHMIYSRCNIIPFVLQAKWLSYLISSWLISPFDCVSLTVDKLYFSVKSNKQKQNRDTEWCPPCPSSSKHCCNEVEETQRMEDRM